MLNVIGKVEDGGSKYILFNNDTNETVVKSPSECRELALDDEIIGIMLNGASIRPGKYHKWKPLIGQGQPEVYTVVERQVTLEQLYFKLSDRVGNLKIVTSAELLKMYNDGECINGVKMRGTSLMVDKKIPSKIVRNKEDLTCTI